MGFLLNLPKTFPKLSRCCCCCGCSLGTGLAIIAVLSLVGGGLEIYSSSSMSSLGKNVTIKDTHSFEHTVYQPSTYTESAVGPIRNVAGISAFLSLLGGLLGIMGLGLTRPKLVLGFFYTKLVNVLFAVISVILSMSSAADVNCDHECTIHGGDEVTACITLCATQQKYATAFSVANFLFGAVLSLYFVTVIASYYNYLQEYGAPGVQQRDHVQLRPAPNPVVVAIHNPAVQAAQSFVQPLQPDQSYSCEPYSGEPAQYAPPVQPTYTAQQPQGTQYAQSTELSTQYPPSTELPTRI